MLPFLEGHAFIVADTLLSFLALVSASLVVVNPLTFWICWFHKSIHHSPAMDALDLGGLWHGLIGEGEGTVELLSALVGSEPLRY